ncbi:MAG: site-specific integrase [Acetobacteraceae bacterium]
MLGESMPPWDSPRAAPTVDHRFQSFAEYLREVRGNPPQTIHKKLAELTAFDRYRRRGSAADQPVHLSQIDAYIVACRRRFARRTVASICSTIRGYLRFLHASGAMDTDLAASVMAPIVRTAEQPHRALPWVDVQRILHAVDRTTAKGRRDYALLLMMSVYGLGAGEVIRISLEDIDWQAATIRIRRPKNGVIFQLPLLPAVARALVDYLKHGRPAYTPARYLFVTVRVPFERLACSTTVRWILHAAAHRAGVTAAFLGTHALRHTHACRQLELGTPPKIIGDILGHRDPESTSAYLRVTSERLRKLSLPLPV